MEEKGGEPKMDAYANLKKLNVVLPELPPLGGLYLRVRRVGNLAFVSGQGPNIGGKPAHIGKVGREVTVEQGQEAAKACALNALAVLEDSLGSLDNVVNVVKVLGFVASAPDFNEQPKVINGCSQFLIDVFGESGRHARSAIGTNELPGNIPVEIEFIFEVK
jgi:enamine deaminase RidA (YjgF/YER057c/UK114 family)